MTGSACEQLVWDSLEGEQSPHAYQLVEQLYHFATVSARAVGALEAFRREETLADRARVLIDAQLHTGINVTEIADLLRVGRTSLFCAFRDGLGMSPVQYLRHRRIARSRELLAASGTTLEEVARTCGFRNTNYFMRTFKELTGQTPTQWRRERMKREA